MQERLGDVLGSAPPGGPESDDEAFEQVRQRVLALISAARTLSDTCADLADALRPVPGMSPDDPIAGFGPLRAERTAALLDEAASAARGTLGLLHSAYGALDNRINPPVPRTPSGTWPDAFVEVPSRAFTVDDEAGTAGEPRPWGPAAAGIGEATDPHGLPVVRSVAAEAPADELAAPGPETPVAAAEPGDGGTSGEPEADEWERTGSHARPDEDVSLGTPVTPGPAMETTPVARDTTPDAGTAPVTSDAETVPTREGNAETGPAGAQDLTVGPALGLGPAGPAETTGDAGTDAHVGSAPLGWDARPTPDAALEVRTTPGAEQDSENALDAEPNLETAPDAEPSLQTAPADAETTSAAALNPETAADPEPSLKTAPDAEPSMDTAPDAEPSQETASDGETASAAASSLQTAPFAEPDLLTTPIAGLDSENTSAAGPDLGTAPNGEAELLTTPLAERDEETASPAGPGLEIAPDARQDADTISAATPDAGTTPDAGRDARTILAAGPVLETTPDAGRDTEAISAAKPDLGTTPHAGRDTGTTSAARALETTPDAGPADNSAARPDLETAPGGLDAGNASGPALQTTPDAGRDTDTTPAAGHDLETASGGPDAATVLAVGPDLETPSAGQTAADVEAADEDAGPDAIDGEGLRAWATGPRASTVRDIPEHYTAVSDTAGNHTTDGYTAAGDAAEEAGTVGEHIRDEIEPETGDEDRLELPAEEHTPDEVDGEGLRSWASTRPTGAYLDPAYPDPAYPDPAYPDPAYPDPADPDPAYPDPAYPDPAYPDPADTGPADTGAGGTDGTGGGADAGGPARTEIAAAALAGWIVVDPDDADDPGRPIWERTVAAAPSVDRLTLPADDPDGPGWHGDSVSPEPRSLSLVPPVLSEPVPEPTESEHPMPAAADPWAAHPSAEWADSDLSGAAAFARVQPPVWTPEPVAGTSADGEGLAVFPIGSPSGAASLPAAAPAPEKPLEEPAAAVLARQVEAARRHLQAALVVANGPAAPQRLGGLLTAIEQVLTAVTDLARETRGLLESGLADRTFPGEARFLCSPPWEGTNLVGRDAYGDDVATPAGLAKLLRALGYEARSATSAGGVAGVQIRGPRYAMQVALVEPAGGGRQRWSGALEWEDESGASRTWAETLGPVELEDEELARRVDELLRRSVPN